MGRNTTQQDEKKDILFIVHMFYPETASTGQLMTELCLELNKKNEFNISVIATSSSYSSSFKNDSKLNVKNKTLLYELVDLNGIKIYRTRDMRYDKKNKFKRIMHIVTYFVSALIIALFVVRKVDLVFSISQPPIIGGLLGKLVKKIKKVKFIYNIQDFNPEQSEVVKYTKNKFINDIARHIDIGSCRKADKVILVGRDMLEYYKKRCNLDNAVVINNWCDDERLHPLDDAGELKTLDEYYAKLGIDKEKIIIGYSGNIGLYYDLENIIKAVELFKHYEGTEFVFIGDGALKDYLVEFCKERGISNVKFYNYFKKDELLYTLNIPTIHIVSNKKGIKGISVPSKIYAILAIGKPIIGVLEKGSEARIIIEEANCGICVEPGNYREIAKCFEFVIDNQELLSQWGKNAREYYVKNFSKKKSIEMYFGVIKEFLRKEKIQ
ncbi:MAG: glycosyltransferase family 4 protein [Candidatus Aenigmatarchaeota archaeon]